MDTAETIDAYQIIERAHDDFATAEIQEAFNWHDFAEYTNLTYWYMVVFRSVRTVGADVEKLSELDEIAHLDAATQPGFLFYFKGKIQPGASHLKNLSFCMWESKDYAKASAMRPAHRGASAVALTMYENYTLRRYDATVHREGGIPWVEFKSI